MQGSVDDGQGGVADGDLLVTKWKRRGMVPLVENEVRRRPRIQEINKGFKNKPCTDNSCLPCHSQPPVMQNKVVRNLASSFCKVAEENLDANISKKAKKNGKSGKGAYGLGPHAGKGKKPEGKKK